jgi:hypothetical protein
VSHIPDLQRTPGGRIAVGWLHPDHDFSRGETPPEFLAKLKRLVATRSDSIKALHWGAKGGFHSCEFCGGAHASGTFGVPHGADLFYVPEMIAHYVEEHEYQPPADFVAAVLACPIPGTKAYAAAVERFANS